jgi:F-type H+-transporting ATPase subunit c
MENIGAGLAALGVVGPALGIGILTGMATTAIARNPEATPAIRAQFILGAAFAEGLGVLAIVVAILAIVLGGGAA